MLNDKHDFTKLLERIISPLAKFYSEGKAELVLGASSAIFTQKTSYMEGFSRILWGIVPFLAGGGENVEYEKLYNKGFENGTDPNHDEFWGEIGNYHQCMVEMAAIGLSLILAPRKFWEPLSNNGKKNLAAWLWQINEYETVDSNWKFFNILTNLGLKNVGAKYSRERLEYSLGCIEKYYIGNGWYCDGVKNQIDYYVGFAFHFYGLIYAKIMENEDSVRSDVFKNRAKIFAKDFIYWFADNGSAIPFGRSLTYRFAQGSFWSACVFAGIEPFPLGVMKGIISRHLEWWMSQPIFDNAGILSVGYAYPNIYMAEEYNSPGSPYWALKIFLILALKEDHEFWKINVEPMPKLNNIKIIPAANMITQRSNGHVTAFVPGNLPTTKHTHCIEKYGKFAYSTAFGFSVPHSYYEFERSGCDNMLVFDIKGTIKGRGQCEKFEIVNGTMMSEWKPASDIQVKTILTPKEGGYERRHIINADIDCVAFDCGFSIPQYDDDYTVEKNESALTIINKYGYSSVSCKCGLGAPSYINRQVNTNILFSRSFTPYIKYNIKKGEKLKIISEFKGDITYAGNNK